MANTDRSLAQTEPFIEDTCEQLFLLEVLVDKIDIKTEGLLGSIEKQEQVVEVVEEEEAEDEDEDDEDAARKKAAEKRKKTKRVNNRPIKVKVNFFDFPTIEIDEWDFTEAKDQIAFEIDQLKQEEDEEEEEERAEEAGMTVEEWREEKLRRIQELADELKNTMPAGDKFCSGKSCLFPIIPLDLVSTLKKKPLYVEVHRSGDSEQAPRLIGRTTIELGTNFNEAIQLASTPTVLPVSAHIDGPYDVTNVFGDVTAIVYLYVRLSCFGNSIFTQFKLNEGEEDYLFKMSGKSADDVERFTKGSRKGKKVDELPKLSPFLTKSEDFQVGKRAPVLYPMEPSIKLPIKWRRKNDKLINYKVCGPEKLFRKASKVSYRNAVPEEIELLQQVIPGFGRQIGDPSFFERDTTVPRYTEQMKLANQCAEEGEQAAKEEEEEEQETLVDNRHVKEPGAILTCQYGKGWPPIKFPLPRQELFPPLRNVIDVSAEHIKTLFESMKSTEGRRMSAPGRIERVAPGSSQKIDCVKLECTCHHLAKNINQILTPCTCEKSLKESKFLPRPEEVKQKKLNVEIDDELMKECIKEKFPIFDDIDLYDMDLDFLVVNVAKVDYDFSGKGQKVNKPSSKTRGNEKRRESESKTETSSDNLMRRRERNPGDVIPKRKRGFMKVLYERERSPDKEVLEIERSRQKIIRERERNRAFENVMRVRSVEKLMQKRERSPEKIMRKRERNPEKLMRKRERDSDNEILARKRSFEKEMRKRERSAEKEMRKRERSAEKEMRKTERSRERIMRKRERIPEKNYEVYDSGRNKSINSSHYVQINEQYRRVLKSDSDRKRRGKKKKSQAKQDSDDDEDDVSSRKRGNEGEGGSNKICCCRCSNAVHKNSSKAGANGQAAKTDRKDEEAEGSDGDAEELAKRKAIKDSKLLDSILKEQQVIRSKEYDRRKRWKACEKKKFLLKKLEERRELGRVNTVAPSLEKSSSRILVNESKHSVEESSLTLSNKATDSDEEVKPVKDEAPPVDPFKDLIALRGRLYEACTKTQDKAKNSLVTSKKTVIKEVIRNPAAYVYTDGMYPNSRLGHKTCVPKPLMVPPSSGWLWDYCTMRTCSTRYSNKWKAELRNMYKDTYKEVMKSEYDDDDDDGEDVQKSKKKAGYTKQQGKAHPGSYAVGDKSTHSSSPTSDTHHESKLTPVMKSELESILKNSVTPALENKLVNWVDKFFVPQRGVARKGDEDRDDIGHQELRMEEMCEVAKDHMSDAMDEEAFNILKNVCDGNMKKFEDLVEGHTPITPTLHLHKSKGKYLALMVPRADPFNKDTTKNENMLAIQFDPRHPDGSSSGDVCDDSSTNSEDSFEIDVVCPPTLTNYILPPLLRSISCQTGKSVAGSSGSDDLMYPISQFCPDKPESHESEDMNQYCPDISDDDYEEVMFLPQLAVNRSTAKEFLCKETLNMNPAETPSKKITIVEPVSHKLPALHDPPSLTAKPKSKSLKAISSYQP